MTSHPGRIGRWPFGRPTHRPGALPGAAPTLLEPAWSTRPTPPRWWSDAAEKLALQGHHPVITHENGPRLVRLAEQMIDAFGIGRETEQDDD